MKRIGLAMAVLASIPAAAAAQYERPVVTLREYRQTWMSLAWPATADAPGSEVAAPIVGVAWSTTGELTNDNFDAALVACGGPMMVINYSAQTPLQWTLEGLEPSTPYWVALRTYSNFMMTDMKSDVSENIIQTTLGPDFSPPPAVDDFTVVGGTIGVGNASFTCTVPFDNGGGTVICMAVCVSTVGVIDTLDKAWGSWIVEARNMTPEEAGTLVQFDVYGLEAGLPYWIAVISGDDAPESNWSLPSNNQSRVALEDTYAPAATTLSIPVNRPPGALYVGWVAPGDDNWTGTATLYSLRQSTTLITEQNFDDAPEVPGVEAPKPGGSPEMMLVEGLLSGTHYYFAIKTRDDMNRWSPMSNVADAVTKDVNPPAAIDDLHVVAIDFDGADLTWSGSGNNGEVGQSWRYILKYSPENPVGNSNWWNTARFVYPEPTVHGPFGTPESFRVPFPAERGEQLWFAIKALDDEGNESPISNIETAIKPGDHTPPERIIDLRSPAETGCAYDFDPYTGQRTYQQLVATVKWTAPADVEDHVSSPVMGYDLRRTTENPADFATIEDWWYAAYSTYSVAVHAPGSTETYGDPPYQPGLYYYGVRSYDFWGNQSLVSNVIPVDVAGNTVAPPVIGDLFAAKSLSTSIKLTWTAPPDDGASGKADQYLMRYSPEDPAAFASLNDWLYQSQRLNMPLPPATAGTPESVTLTGLSPDTAYTIVIGSFDSYGNFSGYCHPFQAWTRGPDAAPPATIAAVTARLRQSNYLVIEWTATGDDGVVGRAEKYELRMSTSAPAGSPADWWTSAAPLALPLPAPAPAGAIETLRIDGLTPGTTYHFAVRAMDDDEKWSGHAMPSAIQTEAPDVVAPGAVSTLRVLHAEGDRLTVEWTAEGEDGVGSLREVQAVELRYSLDAPGSATWWTHATPVAGIAAAAPGSVQWALIDGLQANRTYYVALKSVDEAPNWSALSNVAEGQTEAEGSGGNTSACSAAGGSGVALVALAFLACAAACRTR